MWEGSRAGSDDIPESRTPGTGTGTLPFAGAYREGIGGTRRGRLPVSYEYFLTFYLSLSLGFESETNPDLFHPVSA